MSHYRKYKYDLEDRIITSVLYENSYSAVAYILSPKNFSVTVNVNKQLIWKAIQGLYPKHPINLMTVRRYVLDVNDVDYAVQLTEISNHIGCSSYTYDALLLVELSIRETIQKELLILESNSISHSNFSSAATYKELKNHFDDMNNDVFDGIDGAINYLKSCSLEPGEKFFEEIQNAVSKKVRSIKNHDMVERLNGELEVFSGHPEMNVYWQNSKSVKRLLRLASKLSIQPKVDELILNKISDLEYAI